LKKVADYDQYPFRILNSVFITSIGRRQGCLSIPVSEETASTAQGFPSVDAFFVVVHEVQIRVFTNQVVCG
jgi:hypothetical protein